MSQLNMTGNHELETPLEMQQQLPDIRYSEDPSISYELSKPSDNPELERQRGVVRNVQEMDTKNPEALDVLSHLYLRLLKQRANRHHFTNIPNRVEDLKRDLAREGNHGLTVFNVLGEIVGFATISDAERDQNDSWLNKMVIVNNLQNKNREEKSRHVGRQMLDKIVSWAFITPTVDSRKRESLHAAIIIKVPNSQRMDDLLTHYGFKFKMRLENQARVFLKGKSVLKPVERFAIDRTEWETQQHFHELHENITMEITPN